MSDSKRNLSSEDMSLEERYLNQDPQKPADIWINVDVDAQLIVITQANYPSVGRGWSWYIRQLKWDSEIYEDYFIRSMDHGFPKHYREMCGKLCDFYDKQSSQQQLKNVA